MPLLTNLVKNTNMDKKPKPEIEAIYPLSPMQQGMLFHSLQHPDEPLYFEQLHCVIEAELDIEAFSRAWQTVVNRHSILRTCFVWKRLDKLLQVVNKSVAVPVEYADWRGESSEVQSARFQAFLSEDKKRGFNLGKAPLLRLALFRMSDRLYRFVWSNHHILLDGWSLPLLLGEILECYEAYLRGANPALPPVRPYRDYINWLQQQDMARAEEFWRQRLGDFAAPTPLTMQRISPRQPRSDGGYLKAEYSFSAATTAQLQAFAQHHRITLNTLVQGAWALLLNHYSGENDVVFGTTVSGRPPDLSGSDRMLGLFINTLPNRIRIGEKDQLVPWLQAIQSSQYETRDFEYTPLTEVHGWSRVPRSQPLFNSILVFENYPVDSAFSDQSGSLRFSDIVNFERTNYPLTVAASPGKEFYLAIAYEEALFDDQAIQRMLGHLANLLKGFVERPSTWLTSYTMLAAEEYDRIISDWSQSPSVDLPDTTIDTIFARQADETPDATALVFREQQLTFQDLNERANRLAHHLISLKVGPEKLVAICLDRSIEMIVAMLAVLKAGGAYLPVDPALPVSRIAYLLEDGGVSIVLTSQDYIELAAFAGKELIPLDRYGQRLAQESAANPASRSSADNLAYVIYTSGSTGKPKGVMLSHSGVINLVDYFVARARILPPSRVLQFASFGFDASVMEILGGLLRGATLVLTPREVVQDEQKLLDLLRREQITHAFLPPAMLMHVPNDELPLLRTVTCGGDVCTWEMAARWGLDHRLFNAYGPTEISVACCFFEAREPVDGTWTVPIGKPIQNVQMYVLDGHLQPVPAGVPGELYVGGVGLGRGYLKHPEQTADKFIPNPFSKKPGERLYRTGDKVRLLADGNVEFLGRIDKQVKIRGFRIETGEIEYVLSQVPGVTTALVVVAEDERGEKKLVAYLLLEPESPFFQDELRDYTRKHLPEYMVPAHFIEIDHLPLTPNGKIDYKALPSPDRTAADHETFVMPRTPAEELLVSIWGGILGLQKISANANFFDLGGHSLLATRVMSRIREIFQVELPIQTLFETEDLAALAEAITRAQAGENATAAPAIVPVTREGDLPLSYAQQRLWFLDQLEPGSLYYNIPTAVRLSGTLDIEAVKSSLSEIIHRHESMRTRFSTRGGLPVQIIEETAGFNLQVTDLTAFAGDAQKAEVGRVIEAQLQQPFNLQQAPLFRFSLLRLGEEEHILAFTVHHIIADGWSLGLLVEEFAALYTARIGQVAAALPALPIQYADFAVWQKSAEHAAVLDRQLEYWREQLQQAPPLLELPTDRPRPSRVTYNGAVAEIVFPAEQLQALYKLCRDNGVTPFMVLLAVYQLLLRRYSGQDDILVGSAIANRNRQEIENLIGFFVNTLVFRTRFSGELTFAEVLKQVRQRSLEAFAHQDVPFELVVEALNPVRDLSHSPIFQAFFVLQNAPVSSFELPQLQLEPYALEDRTAKFDITLTMVEQEGQLLGYLEYNTDLFTDATIQRMLEHLRSILDSALLAPEKRIDDLVQLTSAERERILYAWNQSESDYPSGQCIHECFAAMAARQPEAIAASYKGSELTYGELDRRANQLARYLRKSGVHAETLIGISMHRSLEMVVAMLGVVKAGGAFVPIDPTLPQDRLAYLVEDSRLALLLSQEVLRAQFASFDCRLIAIDSEWLKIALEPAEAPAVALSPDNLAYVIYTSGSTGKPKGSLLAHRGLCNLANAQRKAFAIAPESRILQFASLSFDASVWETVMALLNGARLCLADREVLASGQGLVDLIEQECITTVTLPPSVVSVMPHRPLPSLKTMITAGEECRGDLVAKWSQNRQFVNAYGPTETTVCASMFVCPEGYDQTPPIGRPIDNARLYVLDRKLQPVPIGVAGELHVGGLSLARGYLNRAELTAEKFIPDPFSAEPGARLYCTGDLVRYLPDGQLEFLGRIDLQVKIRGFRIELGEIEAHLHDHPAVTDVAVLAREDRPGDKRLAAYIVSGAPVQPEELKKYLKARLPEYMVPALFTFLESMPLNTSGKINRQALPAPDQSRPELMVDFVAPRNLDEEVIAGIAAGLLGLERVGIHDSFFELGGHSLLATQMVSKLRDTFTVELPLRILFEKPSVAELAEVIQEYRTGNGNGNGQGHGNGEDAASIITRVERSEKSFEDLLAEIEGLSEEEVQATLKHE